MKYETCADCGIEKKTGGQRRCERCRSCSNKLRNLGRTHLKGRTLSLEHRAKISAAATGRTASPETRAKLSAAHKGKTVSPEARAKISAAGKGKTQSPEWIQKRIESRGMKYNEGPVWTQGERGQKNAWSLEVKKRDGRCVYCGSKEKLNAHHILSAHKHPEFRLIINNGITLCHTCHWDEHRLNGYL